MLFFVLTLQKKEKQMMYMKRFVMLLMVCVAALFAKAQYSAYSPNQELKVTITTERTRKGSTKFFVPKKMRMSVSHNGRSVIARKEVGLVVKTQGRRYSFGKSDMAKSERRILQMDNLRTVDERLVTMDLQGGYNSLLLTSQEGICLEVRLYNNGVAYRFHVSAFPAEYKILEIADVFPQEKGIAILGTYDGDYITSWRTLNVDEDQEVMPEAAKDFRTRHVSWRDALSTVSIGAAANWYNGDAWKNIGQDHSILGDFTYKHIYGGVGFTPCHETLYIYYDDDYEPFTGVMGSVHSWLLSGKVGYNIPIQTGYNVWNISPYAVTSLMRLRQHGEIYPGHNTVAQHHRYLMGAGLKVQCAVKEGFAVGASYEYQFFTGSKTPRGMNSVAVTLGWLF